LFSYNELRQIRKGDLLKAEYSSCFLMIHDYFYNSPIRPLLIQQDR